MRSFGKSKLLSYLYKFHRKTRFKDCSFNYHFVSLFIISTSFNEYLITTHFYHDIKIRECFIK